MKLLALCLACFPLASFTLAAADSGQPANNWSPTAAASYLDGRAAWWATWPNAAKDHGTFCISCHTVAPYMVGRIALRNALGETEAPPAEQAILDNLGKRVRIWNELEPFYNDAKSGPGTTARARGTEAVLTALALVWNSRGPSGLTSDAKLALDNMWGEQVKSGDQKGSWEWIEFQNTPWEGGSRFYGSTLAAIAAGTAPPDPRYASNLDALRAWLIREYPSQKPIDRVMMIWASTRVSGLLTPAQRDAIIRDTIAKQAKDGGFSLSAFIGDWKRKDNTPLETKSDGYATGLIAYVLRESDAPAAKDAVARAQEWLRHNQQSSDGRWLAYSPNKQRDLKSDIGRFMSDAATAYAVMALEPQK
ncbi:MAG TPA: hypothetical protein VKB79_01135 [Bryobacteraceae bacterium]|nr:hypothetical protein [Bryobacteraceae bacterium]